MKIFGSRLSTYGRMAIDVQKRRQNRFPKRPQCIARTETKGVCCDSEQAYEVLRPVSQCGVSTTIVVALPNGERRPLNGHRLSNMVNS
ncbi:hypothetical protein HZH68_007381 [Vespula germanica]|uniref:Uncharacterized protein n=1 Tax=Vespula germanica TaxID=30212 RepID=A0A834K9C2_VESGE|nr:hypothetical protein HZH68_007381 [Vespula germanica]